MKTTIFWKGFKDELIKLSTQLPIEKVKTKKNNVLGNNKPKLTSQLNLHQKINNG